MKTLNQDGKEALALALILLKDFKAPGTIDPDVTRQVIELATYLGILAEYNRLLPKIPPMKIQPRA